jgi:hypothetical protein
MRHPAHDVLRRLLDEPAGVGEADRRHVATCPSCLRALAGAREAVGEPVAVARPRSRHLRRPAVAAAAVGLVVAGAGTAAANDWLQVFRTEQVAAVRITPSDLVGLPDLSAYGELAVDREPEVTQVQDAAAAADRTGLPVPDVGDLPSGVAGRPAVSVADEVSAVFTFSASRAAEAAGEDAPAAPDGLDGAQVRLQAGPGVASVWTSRSGTPALVVGRAVAPTATSTGVPFATLRDHLLSLPGVPDELADQLRAFPADGSTLPLLVPADQVTTTSTTVGGARATVLATHDRSLAAVVWVDDGLLTVVAGVLDADEVLDVARALR